jgi:hypothetical protein
MTSTATLLELRHEVREVLAQTPFTARRWEVMLGGMAIERPADVWDATSPGHAR